MNIDTRLSYSSAQKLKTCEQKFYYYKHDAEVDPSIETDSTAFIIGKSFHYILEESKHGKPKDIKRSLKYCVDNLGLTEEQVPLVHGMCLSYLRLRKKHPLKCLAVELELTNKEFIGFVDGIMEDEEGKFWILDLKTAGRVSDTLAARLTNDQQLNLYAAFSDVIAKALELDPKKFAGCIYNVTTKPRIRQKSGESYTDYTLRIASSARCFEYRIPKDKLDPQHTYESHVQEQQRALKIISGEIKPTRNYGACEQYFRSCEYWHLCYGAPFKDKLEELDVLTNEEV